MVQYTVLTQSVKLASALMVEHTSVSFKHRISVYWKYSWLSPFIPGAVFNIVIARKERYETLVVREI